MKLSSVILKLTKHVIQFEIEDRSDTICWKNRCMQRKKFNGSTSFAIDNMHYVSFRIWEQESVPWCGEIQNRRSNVLGKTFNLHSNSTWCPRCVISQLVTNGLLESDFHSLPHHYNDVFLTNNFLYVFPFVSNQYI